MTSILDSSDDENDENDAERDLYSGNGSGISDKAVSAWASLMDEPVDRTAEDRISKMIEDNDRLLATRRHLERTAEW